MGFRTHRTHRTLDIQSFFLFQKMGRVSSLEENLDFILGHFVANYFPRTISTKTTQGSQVMVYNKEEALARFAQANYLDCRINAYCGDDIRGDPNFIFCDIDSTHHKVLEKILSSRFKRIEGYPTVLFTGSGFHIYQPIDSICLDEIAELSSYHEPGNQFLKFAERYLSTGKSDAGHNPSFRSCMVRIPGSINSKNGNQVKVLQEWDGNRLHIALMLGSFMSWLANKKIVEISKFAKLGRNFHNRATKSHVYDGIKINWIEVLLQRPLDDYRKTIVNLVLAPYLINIRSSTYEKASAIINEWLQRCAALRKLDFNHNYLINSALVNARKTAYKPMRYDTLKQRNPTISEIIFSK